MKNILAIIALVVLCSTLTFAADTWTATPTTGTYSASVLCTPTLNPGNLTFNLGNYFPGTIAITAPTNKMEWTLTGPTAGTYTIALTNYSITKGGVATTAAPALTGYAYLTNGNNVTTQYTGNSGSIPAGTQYNTSATGAQLFIDCAATTPKVVKGGVVVSSITPGATTGDFQWAFSFTVSASI
jgi:hypothetical protein